MKQAFYIFCVLTVIVGLGFYHSMEGVSKDARGSDSGVVKTAMKAASTEVSVSETINAGTAKILSENKKGCSCCRTTLENIKQKRKELEIWAREMIETHGYEEGMKRVIAKSPTLAKRVRGILEQEKNSWGNFIRSEQ